MVGDVPAPPLPDAETEIVGIIASGDRVASEHIARGTHTGFATSAGVIPATRRSIELRIAETYELKEGMIRRLHAYYDTSTLLRQLGLLPASGSRGERAMTGAMAPRVRLRRRQSRRQ
ncbi:MAG: ester cyclase [Candidatus Dormibacteria bacterium]